MFLVGRYILPVGAFLIAHDRSTDRWVSAFCWSGMQILQTLRLWSISIEQITDTTNALVHQSTKRITQESARQPIYVEGQVSICFWQQFQHMETLREIGMEKGYSDPQPLPTEQIILWCAYPSPQTLDAVAVYFTDRTGMPNLVIIRNQLQSLKALSYNWMADDQKQRGQLVLSRLPVDGDDLDVPTLIQGDLVRMLIRAHLLYDATFPSETPT